MKKGHRKFHHLFWYVAGPLLLLFLFVMWPSSEIETPTSKIPAGSSTAIIP